MSALLSRFSGTSPFDLGCGDHRFRVLVVEDDPGLCDLYREVFEEAGCCVLISSRTFASCDDVAALKPSLILLDLFFRGELDGPRFLTLLKSDPRTEAIPVAVVSGASKTLDELAPALREWHCSVLLKPFDIDDLLKLLLRRDPAVQPVADRLTI